MIYSSCNLLMCFFNQFYTICGLNNFRNEKWGTVPYTWMCEIHVLSAITQDCNIIVIRSLALVTVIRKEHSSHHYPNLWYSSVWPLKHHRLTLDEERAVCKQWNTIYIENYSCLIFESIQK